MGNYVLLNLVYIGPKINVVIVNFFGNIDAKIDNKGRCFIPSQFRKILLQNNINKVVLRKNIFEPSLVIYPYSEWVLEFTELKKKLDPWNPKHQKVQRQYASNLEVIELDTNGRILIPKRYLEEANICSELRFVGIDSKIEIWAKEMLQENALSQEEFLETLQNL